jgi:nuclear pore complex protein Nup133
MLVALTGLGSTDYALLELDLTQDSAIIRRAIPIRNLQQESTVHDLAGSLLLPGPQHTAFIQFPGAIVIASLAEPEESPNTQLELDSGRPAFPYQDTIYLRKESHDAICGSASEVSTKKDRHACALMFIRGCGVIQISALPPAGEDAALDRCKVTAKSKLEQATFFSTHPDNIIDFSIKSRYTFDDDEVEQAAVQISTDILSSSYDQIDSVTSSVEDQIRQRAMALRTLRAYLQAEFDHSPLSTQGKWHLLSQAEKVAAAAEIWKDYQKKVSDKELRPEKYPESLLLPHMVKCLHEKWKTVIRPELGETDPVRQFFIKDLNRLEILIPWAWMTLRTFYLNHNNGKDRAAIMQRISEGNDIIITALQTAFKFREENCQDYGLDPDELSFGVLKPNNGQEFIPNFWTSTHNMVATIRSLTDVGRNYAYETFEQGVHEEIAMKIAKDNPLLVDLGLKTHIERFTWALAQDDPKLQETGKHLQQEFIKTVRPEHIYGLANIGMADAGMNLAESYNDLGTLAHLIWDETIYLERSKENTQSKVEHAECVNKLKRIKDRIQRYFDKFGDSWASAFYRRYIKEGRSERLFHKEYLNQPALTKFLRTNPSVARLSWINEISGERDYGKAHDTLVEVAMSQETNGWCKKVELSLAKLSMLAKIEQQSEPTAKDAAKLAETVSRQEYVKIQDRLYERIAPTLEEALDDESAIGLLMDEFGKGRLVDRPAHQQLLRQGFEDLVNHRVLDPALLIDILTLMTYDESKPPVEIIQSNEFAFALKALVLSWQDMNKTTRVNTLRLIWKRVCIADNWAEINNTKEITSDVKLEELLAQTALGRTFHTLLQMISKSMPTLTLKAPTTPHVKSNKQANADCADKDRKNAVAWPKFDIDKLFGAGCTNGELCTRFGSEDLRNPIIADNVADDEVLQENIQKHRLDEWFRKVMQYAMKRVDEEQKQGSAESMDGGPVGGELVQGDETLGDVEMADA